MNQQKQQNMSNQPTDLKRSANKPTAIPQQTKDENPLAQNPSRSSDNENIQPKTPKQKKKQRKKRIKEKNQLENKSIQVLERIIISVYQNGKTYEDNQQNIKQIIPNIISEEIFIRILNQVIVQYVQNSIQTLNEDLTIFLQNQNLQHIIICSESLKQSPELFKKMTNFLYRKYLDIQRAGNNILLILQRLRPYFNQQKYKHTYLSLNRNVFRYLIYDHEELKLFINYSYRLFKAKNLQKCLQLDQDTLQRIDYILNILSPYIQASNRNNSSFQKAQEQVSEDDLFIEQEQDKDKDKKAKKRKNKKKNKNKQKVQTVEPIEIQQTFQDPTIIVLKKMLNLSSSDQRLTVKLSKEFLKNIESKKI